MTIAVTTATITEADLQTLCTQLVQREVCHTISNLVHTLAQSYGGRVEDRDLSDLTEEAYELARPVEDWEEAAEQAGCVRTGDTWSHEDHPEAETSASAICYALDIEPYQWEVYEHWIVTDWLGARLVAEGERVDTDFAGLTVWARTTTGQAISMDHVIRQIVKKLHDVKEAE